MIAAVEVIATVNRSTLSPFVAGIGSGLGLRPPRNDGWRSFVMAATPSSRSRIVAPRRPG
jgi:hypothetical protein